MKFCDALVDQNRYIGKDPVGYKCMNTAIYGVYKGKYLCQDCFEMIMEKTGRVSFKASIEGVKAHDPK